MPAPRGPLYVTRAAAPREARLPELPPLPDVSRSRPPEPVRPAPELMRCAAELLSTAKAPVILAGRSGRDEDAWRARVQLAETLGARVITDLKAGAVFPTGHPLHVGP